MLEIILKLNFIGLDYFSVPSYKDQFGRIWKDLNLGEKNNLDLYSVTNNDMDGEPCCPINQKFQFEEKPYRVNSYQFQYMMLGRLQSDCDYYLGFGDRNPDRLYDHQVSNHIAHMKELWNEVPVKPKWLTWEQILEYETEMNKQVERKVCPLSELLC